MCKLKNIVRKNLQLFYSFFKIGAFTIGGGYAMIALIEREVTERKKWLSKEEFIDMLAVSQSVPGAISVNTAVFVGYKINGIIGAISAILGCILPSFSIILFIALFFSNFKNNVYVEKIFMGIRPSVVALMVFSLYKITKTSCIKWYLLFWSAAVACLIYFFNMSPIIIILSVIIFSLIYEFIKSKVKKSKSTTDNS